MKVSFVRIGGALALSLAVAMPAQAGVMTFFDDEAGWLTAIGGAGNITQTEDFNSYVADVLIEGSSFDVGDFTISANGTGNNSFNRIDAPAHEATQANQNGTASYYGLHDVDFAFDNPLEAVALDWLDSGGSSQIYDIVIGFTDSTSTVVQFGISGTAAFRGLVATGGQLIESLTWVRSGSTSPFSVDNVRMVSGAAPIPAPVSLGLSFIGLLGFTLERRR